MIVASSPRPTGTTGTASWGFPPQRQFVQDNHSRLDARAVVRGMHFQVGEGGGQARALRSGKDHRRGGRPAPRLADLRPVGGGSNSTTRANARAVCAGRPFAHGFCVLSDVADVLYKQTAYYDADVERGIAWDDPEVGHRVAAAPGGAVGLRARRRGAAVERGSPTKLPFSVASLTADARPVSSACEEAHQTATRSRPRQYLLVAYIALGALTLIVLRRGRPCG